MGQQGVLQGTQSLASARQSALHIWSCGFSLRVSASDWSIHPGPICISARAVVVHAVPYYSRIYPLVYLQHFLLYTGECGLPRLSQSQSCSARYSERLWSVCSVFSESVYKLTERTCSSKCFPLGSSQHSLSHSCFRFLAWWPEWFRGLWRAGPWG